MIVDRLFHWRLALGDTDPALRAKAPKGALHYLKRLYYDTAMSATPYAMKTLRALVEPSQILFGSDSPFLPEPQVAASVKGLADLDVFDAADRRASVFQESDSAFTSALAARYDAGFDSAAGVLQRRLDGRDDREAAESARRRELERAEPGGRVEVAFTWQRSGPCPRE